MDDVWRQGTKVNIYRERETERERKRERGWKKEVGRNCRRRGKKEDNLRGGKGIQSRYREEQKVNQTERIRSERN